MNPSRTYRLEILLGLLGTAVIAIALGLYIAGEANRLSASQGEILKVQLNDSMTLYAENCGVCHGLNGEGIGATPPLNAPGLVDMPYEDLYKVIARGRFETAMPAWSKEDGGPLSDYQIGELVALIQSGDWQETGDSGGAASGDVMVTSDNRLMVRNKSRIVEREVNLSGAGAVIFTLEYLRNGLDDAADGVNIEVSGDGGNSWNFLGNLAGPDNDASYRTTSYNISSFIAPNTRIRFISSGSLGKQDEVFFDNVQITCTP